MRMLGFTILGVGVVLMYAAYKDRSPLNIMQNSSNSAIPNRGAEYNQQVPKFH